MVGSAPARRKTGVAWAAGYAAAWPEAGQCMEQG